MFGQIRRDPLPKLEAEFRRLLEQASDLQRGGGVRGFAAMTSRADGLAKTIKEDKG